MKISGIGDIIPILIIRPVVILSQTCNPYLLTILQRRLADFEVEELESNYTDKVTLSVRLPQEQQATFEKMFTDLTAEQEIIKMGDGSEII